MRRLGLAGLGVWCAVACHSGTPPGSVPGPVPVPSPLPAAILPGPVILRGPFGAQDGGSGPSPIVLENALPGDAGWRLTHATTAMAYVDATSYAAGDAVHLHAAATTAATATWQLWRMGYYAGARGRLLASGGPLTLPAASAPLLDPKTGALSVGYPEALALPVSPQMVTGVYLIKLVTGLGESYATFVVRESARRAPILCVLPVNTYQAYNDWGGISLYTNTRTDWQPWHAYAVSFDRPYATGNGAGEFFLQDDALVAFAEAQGYDIAYATDADLDADPHLAEGRRMLLVQGHSEYWSAAMRAQLEAAIAAGVNTAFFGADDVYWQVRYGPGASGAPRRTLIGYKEFASLDPMGATDPALVTTQWRSAPLDRPENALVGAMFGIWLRAYAPLLPGDLSQWPWTGAGFTPGTLIAGAYGDEADSRYDNGQEPAGLVGLGGADAEGYPGVISTAQTTLYQAPSGAWVFDAGSIRWSRLLAASGVWDVRVQRLAANLFSRMAGNGSLGAGLLVPQSLPPGAVAPSFNPQAQVTTVTEGLTAPKGLAFLPNGDAVVVDGNALVEVTAQGTLMPLAGGEPGFADGPSPAAQFLDPHDVAVAPDGTLYVTDTGNQRIRMVAGGQVSTLAGSVAGYADGPGATAMFSYPLGLGRRPDGTLVVADPFNQRLRLVTPGGVVSTLAGNSAAAVSDGAGARASLSYPAELAVQPDGSVLFTQPNTGVLRVVSLTGQVSTFAGQLTRVGWSDGPLSTASVSETIALASDGTRVVLVDGASARVRELVGGNVDTLAGGLISGSVDGLGAQAGFGFPRAAAFAPDGSVWVVDTAEHALRRIQF